MRIIRKGKLKYLVGALFLFSLSPIASAYDNADDIKLLVQRYTAENGDMRVLKIGSVRFVYNTRFYRLDTALAKVVVNSQGAQSLLPDYEKRISGPVLVLASLDPSEHLAVFYEDDVGGDIGWISLGNEMGTANGQLVYLPRPSSYYFYRFFLAQNQQFPGVVKKFRKQSGELVEVEQPFYRLSLTTKTNSDIELSVGFESSSSVGTIAKGTEVRVLGVGFGKGGYSPFDSEYLLEGKTGTIGWAKAELLRKEKSGGKGIEVYNLDFLQFVYSLN